MQDFRKNKISKKVCLFLMFLLLFSQNFFAQKFYWENPQVITKTDSRFPTTIKMQDKSLLFWQEVDIAKKEIWISCRIYNSSDEYNQKEKIIGPIVYSNEVPDLFSVTINKQEDKQGEINTIAIAVLTDISEISVYTSNDFGNTYQKSVLQTNGTSVAPRIYTTNTNEFILFSSETINNEFTISYATSKDGQKWSNFKNFKPSSSLRNPFIPVLIPLKNQNGNLVIFQAQYTNPDNGRLSYQLYSTFSEGTENWSEPVLLTNQNSLFSNEIRGFYSFQNQRPYLFDNNGEIYIAWERTDAVTSSIWVSQLEVANPRAAYLKNSTINKLTDSGNASRGIIFSFNNKLYTVWFDTRTGRDSVYLAEKNGNYWEEQTLSENRFTNTFAFPLVLKNTKGDIQKAEILAFAWQQSQNNKNSISILLPDTSVQKPSIVLKSPSRKRARDKNITATIKFPSDSSQIAGYSYTWEKDFVSEPIEQIQKFPKENTLKLKAPEDGKYYLSAKVVDYAGNWSQLETLEYHLDLTPPNPPATIKTATDKFKMVMSNTFNVEWEPSVEDDVAGYSYTLEYLGGIPKRISHSKRHPLKLNQNTVNQ